MDIDWSGIKAMQRSIYDQVDAKLRELQVGESLAMRVEHPPLFASQAGFTLVLRVVKPGEIVDGGPWTIYGPMEEHHRRTLEGSPPTRVVDIVRESKDWDDKRFSWTSGGEVQS